MIGDTNFLANYLKNGGDPNLKKEGSPLLALCWVGSGCGYKCAAMLLESGAKADATTSYGDTALMEAAMWADTEGMRLLLRYGANPNAKNQGGETPLHRLASSSSTLEAVKVLVEAKANINAKTKEGETVLDHLKSEPKVVEYLRQIGAR